MGCALYDSSYINAASMFASVGLTIYLASNSNSKILLTFCMKNSSNSKIVSLIKTVKQ